MKSGFADLQGVTPQTVTKWLNDEVIDETEDGFIEWEKAQRSIDASREPGRPLQRKGEQSIDIDSQISSGDLYEESRARKEAAKAELAEMELAEERGRLIDAHEASEQLVDVLGILKSRLRVVPNRLSSTLDDTSLKALTDEIDDALADCADEIESLA